MELWIPPGSVLSFNCHGTLVPEVHGRKVRADPEIARLIDALAANHRVLITSRRTVAQIRETVGAESFNVRYLGKLGLETANGPRGEVESDDRAKARIENLDRFWGQVGAWPGVRYVTSKAVRTEVTIEIHLGEVPERDAEAVGRQITEAAHQGGITVTEAGGQLQIRPLGVGIGDKLTSEVLRQGPEVAMHVGDYLDDAVAHNALRRMVADELLPRAITVGVRSAATPADILRCGEASDDPRVQGFMVDGVEGVRGLLRWLTGPGAAKSSM